MRKNLFIRVDGSLEIGTGHIIRCITLATELKKIFNDIVFLTKSITGNLIPIIEENGFRIIAQKRIKLSNYQAKDFYHIHSEKSFFNDLIEYMTSEPVVVQVLSGNNAIEAYRKITKIF